MQVAGALLSKYIGLREYLANIHENGRFGGRKVKKLFAAGLRSESLWSLQH